MKYILGLLAVFVLSACTSSGTGTAEAGEPEEAEAPNIIIQVKGAAPGQAMLMALFEDDNYRLDSTRIDQSGKMVFRQDKPYPPGLLLLLLPNQGMLQLLVDKDQTFTLTTQSNDLINAMQVEGSAENELLYQDMRFEQELQTKLQEVALQLQANGPETPAYQQAKERQDQLIAGREAYIRSLHEQHPDAFFTKLKLAGQTPRVEATPGPDGRPDVNRQIYRYRTQLWNDVDFSDERLLRTPIIVNKLNRYMTELTAPRADSIIQAADFLLSKVLDHPAYFKFFANWIAIHFQPPNEKIMDPEAVYVHMVTTYFTNERAFWADSAQVYSLQLRAGQMAASLIGEKAPEAAGKDPNGRVRRISEVKTPYLVVFLYNPTCEHCIEEAPKLVDFYRKWKGKGVEVFAIALESKEEDWRQFIAQNKMDWINVHDPENSAFFAGYFIDNTPEIYVLNPDRIIIGKNLKAVQVEGVIRGDQGGG